MNKKLRNAAFKVMDVIMILTLVFGAPMNVAAAPQTQAESPVLSTDLADYAPGESAHITGSGFDAGDYALSASGPDGTADWGTATANEDGGFETDSPALASAGNYEINAYAAGSEDSVASISFTVTEPPAPTDAPTEAPTEEPTATEPPTEEPTATEAPTEEPTQEPTATEPPTATSEPTSTVEPTAEPTQEPTPLPPPYIQSDKADYTPGELVTLTGGNWQGDNQVRIIVNDDLGQTWRRDVTVDVSAVGSIYDVFNLPTHFVANYTVSARGLQTDRFTTTSFTDAPLPANVSMVTWRTSSGGAWINGTLNSTNSDYTEGETVPFRLEAGTLALAGNPYVAPICRDYQLGSGIFGYTTLQPFNTSRAATPGGTISSTSGAFSGVNMTIVSINETGVSSFGGFNCGGTQRLTIVNFNVISAGAQTYLLWGGRLASPVDPGVGAGKSASFWSGGSLQMRLASPDKTAGINPSAIIQLATITVTKIVDSGSATPDQWCFNISPNPNGETLPKCPAPGGNTVTFLGLTTGNYQITETTVNGYAFASGSGTNCTFSGSTATAAVTSAAGAATNASCTFHNAQQQGTITIIKDTVPDDPQDFAYTTTGTGLSSFSLDDDADPTLSNTRTFTNLSAGNYTVTETLPIAGFDLTGLTCSDPDNGSSTSPGTGTATIDLDPNETITCTYVNTKRGTIIVEKQTNPDGLTGSFTFTGTAAGTISDNGQITVPNLVPGTYTSTENDPAPTFGLTSIVCDDGASTTPSTFDLGTRTANFKLDPGEIVKCTFTNTLQQGTLTVIKHVINDNGGTAAAGQWSIHVKSGVNEVTGSPQAGAESPGTSYTLTGGTYNVSETGGPSGYTFTGFSGDCGNNGDVTVVPGQTTTCTLTNDDDAPSLTLVKVVTNDNGGTAVATDFTLSANGPTPISGAGGATSDATFEAGTYDLSETSVPGYTASAWSCVGGTQDGSEITVGLGESATCTITNDDDAPSLTLVKVVVNDNGGTAETTDFTLSADGPTPISGAGGATSGSTFDAGTYDLSETGPAGYTSSDWVCTGGTQGDADTISLDLGESATCSITNDDQAPSLTLVKVVTNNDGGDAVASEWTLTATGPSGFSGAGPSVSNGASFDVGAYDLSESGPGGYSASDWNCVGGTQDDSNTITLELGESATCTISNDDVAPTLKIVKVVTNDNGGNAVADDWTLSADAASPDDGRNFSNAGGSGVFETVFANIGYDLSESTVAGYTAGNWSCIGGTLVDSTVTLAEGETGVTCTITNDDSAPTLTLIKLVVNDDGGNAVVGDFPLFINGNPVTSGAPNTLNANTIYTATETTQPGYTASVWGGDCAADGTITLNEGDNKTCTITNDDVAPTLTLIKNVINDNGGNAGANDFGLSIGGNPATSGVAYTLAANTSYAIDEAGLMGYTFVDITGDPECPALLGGTVTLDEGENVTCTITNDDTAPTLTLIKIVVNDDGGNAVVSDFPLFINGDAVTSGAPNTLSANTLYTASETTLSGYTPSAWGGDCAPDGTITLNEGDNKTCTITNDDVTPTLKLVKEVVNDDGGNASADDWTLSAAAAAPFDGRNFNNAGESGTFQTVFANAGYDLSETTVAGYTAGSWSCDGGTLVGSTVTLTEGETTVTCTIVNDDVAPKLTLIKVVVNDNGGNAQPNDFDLTIGGNPVISGTAYMLDANTAYAINETLLSGYTFVSVTGDPECPSVLGGTVTLDEGANVTCTITNDDSAPTLTLIKNVVNDDGGNAVVGDFPLFIDATPVTSGTPNTLSANVLYTASETTQIGYNPSVWGGDCNPDGTITLDEGESATCTITNDDVAPTLKLVKVVANDNGGNAVADDWTLSAEAASPNDGRNFNIPGGSGVFEIVFANTGYDLSESTVAGYTAGSWSCVGGTLVGSTVTLAEGETGVTCTITNDDSAPTLTLIKIVVNDDGGNAMVSDFPLFIDATSVTSGAPNTLSANVLYTTSETTLAGYTPSTWGGDCAADGTITLDEGESATCMITNDDVAPTLKLVKEVVNDNGGDADADNWTLSAEAIAPFDGRNFSNAGGSGAFETIFANSGYDLSESTVAGYTAGNWICDGGILVGSIVTLDEGETGVTCTITNDDSAPTLTLIKNVVNDDGGNAQPDDFNLTIGGNAALSGVAYTLSANTAYAINETLVSGYTFVDITGSAECPAILGGTVTLDEGENVTCTITNDDVAPTLTLIKDVINDSGGNAQPDDFNLTIGGTAATSGTPYSVDANSAYAIDETLLNGYSFVSITGDAECPAVLGGTVTLDEGENITCTITNNDQPATLIVIKHVVNDNGGSADASDFTLDSGGTNDSPDDFAGSEVGLTVTLDAGSYSVTETGPSGYTRSDSADCSGTIANGETRTCTVTNNDISPTLRVIKVLVPGSDTGLFNLQIDSTTYAANVGNNGTTGFVAVNAGSHTVGETAGTGTSLSNYDTVISGDCAADGTITLALAQNKTCTITNTRHGHIIVDKVTNPSGDSQSFNFTATGSGYASFSLTDAAAPNDQELSAGTYSVSETVPAGWDLTSATCSDGSNPNSINLSAGETVTCTFTNTKRGHIIIDKVTQPSGDTQSFSFDASGGTSPAYVDFNLTDAATPNDQTLKPGSYSVVEGALAGWDLTGLTCNDANGSVSPGTRTANITLDPGETVTCTFTNTKRGSIKIIKDAVPNDAQDFTFTRSFGANFMLDDDSTVTLPNNVTFTNLVPAAYSVTEGTVAGWDLTGLTCNDANGTTNPMTRTANIALDAGENVICTFTNTKRGTIIVEKQTNPNGAPGTFTFTGTVAGTISDNGTITVLNLIPGTYTSTEV